MGKNGRFYLLLSLLVIILGVNILSFVSKQEKKINSPSHFKQAALKLHGSGLAKEAALQYENYLKTENLSQEEQAKIAHTLGELYLELNQKELSLSWFTLAEVAAKDANKKAESSKMVVQLLEQMKKFSAAKMALQRSTSLEKKPLKGATVLAEVGGMPIYEHNLDEAIDQLPASYREQFSTKDGRLGLLQKLVADEILYTRGVRMGLTSAPDVLKRISKLEKALIVEEVFKKEMKQNLKVEEDDIKNYYQANKEKYDVSASITAIPVVIKGKKKLIEFIAKSKKGNPQALASQFSEEQSSIIKVIEGSGHGGLTNEQIKPVFNGKPKSWSEPILSKGKYHLFYIREKVEAQKRSFEQVKEMVEQAYKLTKQQNLYQKLVQDSMKSQDVKVYAERLK